MNLSIYLKRLWGKTMKESNSYEKVSMVHDYCLDLENRIMWIHGTEKGANTDGEEPGVEYQMATKAIKNLSLLKATSSTKEITIFLHTCGGEESEGLAIYDAIKSMPFHVTIISATHARSMSSIIFQAGDERLMYPSSYFMIHRGDVFFDGSYEKFSSYYQFQEKYNEKMFLIYAEKMVQSKKFEEFSIDGAVAHLEALVNQKSDVYMLPEQAIEYNFADGIYE